MMFMHGYCVMVLVRVMMLVMRIRDTLLLSGSNSSRGQHSIN